jgi:hypothetical protein
LKSRNLTPYFLSILILLFLVGLTAGNLYLAERFQVRDKYAVRYVAAKLWMGKGISPYSPEVSYTASEILSERKYEIENPADIAILEPVYFILLYIPLSLLKFDLSRAIWLTLIELSIMATVFLSIKIAGWKVHLAEIILLILFGMLFYPGVKSILFGNPLPISVFLFIMAIYLILIKQETSAGIILVIITSSIEIGIIITIFLLAWCISQKQYLILLIFLGGIVTLFTVSILLFGNWIPEWLSVFLRINPGYSWISTPVMRITSAFKGGRVVLNYIVHISLIIYMLLEWFGAFKKNTRIFIWKTLLTLVIVYLLNLWSKPEYLYLLFPGLFFILRFLSERWKILGKIISWFIILLILVGYWFIFNQKGNWFSVEPSAILLLLPFVILIGLQWVRWWALKLPEIQQENKVSIKSF